MAEPFPLFCSIALITGYCLMGAGWLNWRCTGSLEYRARRAIPWLSALTLVLVTGLLVWTIFLHETWRQHLLNPWLWGPLLTIAAAGLAVLWISLSRHYVFLSMAAIQILVSCAFAALAFTLFPFIVPVNLLIQQAAAPVKTQQFLLLCFACWRR
jgi:cytochrome d ubiquinol oxidase subunit II